MRELLKIELGGGATPRGQGYLNLDKVAGAGVDIVCDFGSGPLPFGDRTVGAVYSSHALEHLEGDPIEVLREVARVCVVGAAVEVRVPHFGNSMAMCTGHNHVISEAQVKQWTEEFIALSWGERPRRLRLVDRHLIPSASFADAQTAFPLLSALQVMRFVPDACHEVRFHFAVISNAERPLV